MDNNARKSIFYLIGASTSAFISFSAFWYVAFAGFDGVLEFFIGKYDKNTEAWLNYAGAISILFFILLIFFIVKWFKLQKAK